jgi:hypothetical protein
MPTRCRACRRSSSGLLAVKELCPIINIEGPRYPVLGALWQPRGGTARHDAVAWGYARACSDMGMDIIQQTEVTGVRREGGKVVGVDTTKGHIACGKLGIVVAGHSGVMAERAGFRLPIESVALQALVSEPIKPCMDVVVMANTVHGYMSQSDKGEMVIGGGADGYNNYTQRGQFHHVEETVRALVETFPIISRLKMLRWWGGIVDMTGDRSPIISKTPVDGVFVNCGWGTGGFKAIPGSGWAMAELMAKGHSPLAAEFGMDRFREGRFIDESRRGGGGALMAARRRSAGENRRAFAIGRGASLGPASSGAWARVNPACLGRNHAPLGATVAPVGPAPMLILAEREDLPCPTTSIATRPSTTPRQAAQVARADFCSSGPSSCCSSSVCCSSAPMAAEAALRPSRMGRPPLPLRQQTARLPLRSRADSKTNHHSPNAGGCHPAPARFLCARPACAHPIFADTTPC